MKIHTIKLLQLISVSHVETSRLFSDLVASWPKTESEDLILPTDRELNVSIKQLERQNFIHPLNYAPRVAHRIYEITPKGRHLLDKTMLSLSPITQQPVSITKMDSYVNSSPPINNHFHRSTTPIRVQHLTFDTDSRSFFTEFDFFGYLEQNRYPSFFRDLTIQYSPAVGFMVTMFYDAFHTKIAHPENLVTIWLQHIFRPNRMKWDFLKITAQILPEMTEEKLTIYNIFMGITDHLFVQPINLNAVKRKVKPAGSFSNRLSNTRNELSIYIEQEITQGHITEKSILTYWNFIDFQVYSTILQLLHNRQLYSWATALYPIQAVEPILLRLKRFIKNIK